ncbi:MAG: rRNA maturation RNase YbeY [Candidatus Wildermuthbacteria bacterium]|nr:rRNA maturation RNase YbeY [Candidatus Wildermuthbacteria bacterium]
MIEINNTTGLTTDTALLLKVAKAVLAKENPPKAQRAFRRADISVALVSSQRARKLNQAYRKKNYVPNILSFSYGEIILCPSRIRQDAKKYGITFKQELARVFTHGLLHLFGYTHERMRRKERTYSTYIRY